jgi:hypothetical protein
MKRATWLLARSYGRLLRLYPASFRAEFGEEMEEVFGQAAADAADHGWRSLAGLCVRELTAWPEALIREWAESAKDRLRREKGAIVDGWLSTSDPAPIRVQTGLPARWPQAVLAALALLVPGLGLIVWPGLGTWHRGLMFGAYLFVLVGLLAGWVRGFPRWCYPYLGYGLLFPLWLSHVASPGLRLLGHTFGANEVWGWRAWLGLEVVALVALLVTRSLRPLARLFTGIWRDWTRLSFALYGTLPFVIWACFDEVHPPYPLPFLTAVSLFLAGGALAHVRSRTAGGRARSLLAGLSAAWLVSTAGLSAYWHGPRVPGHAPFHWSDTAVPMAIAWVAVMAILLLPSVLGLAQRLAQPRRAAR